MDQKTANNQPVTKAYFLRELDKRFNKFTAELSKFLEEKVLEPLFDLKKDVSGLKKDVSGLKNNMRRMERKLDVALEKTVAHDKKLKNHEKRIERLEEPKFA